MEAAGTAVQQRLQEIARSAYDSIETNIYVVNPHLSHMPQRFHSRGSGVLDAKNATIHNSLGARP